MTVYLLPEEPVFPPPSHADPDGLIAIGGDLSAERLIHAYASGIFPWFMEDGDVYWFSPDPRLLLIPDEYRISGSFARVLRSERFQVSIDTCFNEVIRRCAMTKRSHEDETWINDEFIMAYTRLYENGLAHSFETFYNDELVGGLYGISLGAAFFGESMFFERSNASKVALKALVDFCQDHHLKFIDCQVVTPHLINAGARPYPRNEFLLMLDGALNYPTISGSWNLL
jgi:leucyl/phenylalanyl-tRNA--protein transferase